MIVPASLGHGRRALLIGNTQLIDDTQRGSQRGLVSAVSRGASHDFSKSGQEVIRLLAGLGVEGDAHAGSTVQHRSRVAKDPLQPNLRQVHLIQEEVHEELRLAGFDVVAGQMGENVTTRDLDLLRLATGALLHLGSSAVVEVTGLRNPCAQLDRFRRGLLAALLDRDEQGGLIRKSGIMGVVLVGGEVRPGDVIEVEMPAGHRRPLELV
jgi:hypothetical protein